MNVKRKSPILAKETGENHRCKDTKRKRIKRVELVSKWIPPVDVLKLERGLI